jgi:two-component system CheB/CheR fusion protein
LPVQVVGVVIAADDADPIAHVETFLNLIEQWPADAPTAFVVLGAAPGLAEVLAAGMRWRRISVAVERVTGEAALRARSVHVVPFDSIARIVGDRLVVAAADPPSQAVRVAEMLASLVDARGAGAVALVLGPGPDAAAAVPIHAAQGTLVHVPRIAVCTAPIIAALREGLRRGTPAPGAETGGAAAAPPPGGDAPDPEGRDRLEMLRRLLENSAEAVIMLDPEGAVRYFTPGATRHFDLLERDIGRPLRHLAQRVWDPTLHADIHEAGLAGAPTIRDLPTGPDRWTSREIRVMRDALGRNEGYAILYRDVSDYRRMLKSLARAEMKAREVEGALRLDLVALGQGIGQRLRTLGVLIEMMARGAEDGTMLRAEATEVVAALRGRLGALVRVQQRMSGQGARRTEPVLTGDLMRALGARMAARADRQGVNLRIVPSSLGALTDRFLLLALLEALLDEVLTGLDGGRVVVGCRRGGASARIVIAAARRAPPAPALGSMAGEGPADAEAAGRSMAHAIAESLGVVLRTGPGRREIALPLVRPPAALIAPAPQAGTRDAADPDADAATDGAAGDGTAEDAAPARILGARVLLVMRDGHARAVIAALLRAEGHATRTARDIASARAALGAGGGAVDLVLGETAEGGAALARLAATILPRAGVGPVPHLVLPDASAAEGAEPRRGLAGMVAGLLAARYGAAPDPAPPRPGGASPAIALVALRTPSRARMARALRANGARVDVFDSARDLLGAGHAAGLNCVLLDPEGMGPRFEVQLRQLARGGVDLPVALLGTPGDPPLPVGLPAAAVAGCVQRPAPAATILGQLGALLAGATARPHSRAAASGAGRDGAAADAPDHAAGAGGDPPLTDRQREVLEAVLEGHPSKIIAHRLGISQRTVESHRAAIMRAYGARSLPELVRRVLAGVPPEGAGAAGEQPDLGLFRHGIDRNPDEGAPRPSA